MSLLRPARQLAAFGMILIGAAALFFSSQPSQADDPPAAQAGDKQIDPQAGEVIEAMSKYLAGLKTFSANVVVSIHVEQGAQKQDMELTQHLVAERPNKMSITLDGPLSGGAAIVSDGKNLSAFMSATNKYAMGDAPATFGDAFENPIVAGTTGAGNAGMLIAALFSTNPGAKLLEKVTSLEYVDKVDVNGVSCDHLRASQEDYNWEIWIATGERPLVQQFVPDLSKLLALLAKQNPAVSALKLNTNVAIKDWKTDEEIQADQFTFSAPEGAKKVKSFLDIIGGGPNQGPHPLLGKAAPPFALDQLDGEPVELANHAGKDIVILDFWATWCGPCRAAMPKIAQVANEFKDKGVVLYAVNLREDADTIHEFLKENPLDVRIILDSAGKVGEKYKANAIPQTVLIGKDGIVQAVHVGLSPNFEEELRNELEELLAGKNLAAETLAEESEDAPAAGGEEPEAP